MDFANYWFASGPAGAGGYEIGNSLRFRRSQYLSDTLGTITPTNNKIFTLSAWVKYNPNDLAGGPGDRYIFSSTVSGTYAWNAGMNGGSGNRFHVNAYPGYAGDFYTYAFSDNNLRDPAAWYHICVVWDTTHATDTERVRTYINGVRTTLWTGTVVRYPDQNSVCPWNDGQNRTRRIGYSDYATQSYYDGYITEVHNVDGTALGPTTFGEFNADGVWVPIDVSLTKAQYGVQGFYLDFSDPANIGADRSGNGNNFTPTNFELTTTTSTNYDWMADSPTSNCHTWNPLFLTNQSNSNQLGYLTLANANLRATQGGNLSRGGYSTGALFPGGKYYWEADQGPSYGGQAGCATTIGFGVTRATQGISTDIRQWIWYGLRWDGTGNGQQAITTAEILWGGSVQSTITLTNDWRPGRIAGVAIDTTASTNNVRLYIDGTLVGTGSFNFGALPAEASLQQIYTAIHSQPNQFCYLNAGQLPFQYTPPTGHVAPSTDNQPNVTITNSGEHFNTVLYTGTSSTQSITGVGFQPDLVWVKNRDTTNDPAMFDIVRGAGYRLSSAAPTNELNNTSYFTSFDSDGFTVASNGGEVNNNGSRYVAWCWNAGSGSPVSNTAGSITSTVKANQDAGFSVVTYTGNGVAGSTIGHGLNATPALIITKRRDNSSVWNVYHQAMGPTKVMYLNQTSGEQTDGTVWNNTSPGTSVFTIGSDTQLNTNTGTFVAYCWSEVPGFSAFGSYKGSGQANGTFVYTGFRPAFVMIKSTGPTYSWIMKDSARKPYNPANDLIFANVTNAETAATSADAIDLLSNGFRCITAGSHTNTNQQTYIYIAFAEHCFGGGNVAPTPAR